MKEAYLNIELEENDTMNIAYSASNDNLETMIIYMLTIYYEKNNKDLKKMNSLLDNFEEYVKDTSNILHIQL